MRAVAPDAVLLVVATALALLGAGIGNVLLPPLVKRYFPDRMTQVTSLYAVLIAFSTSLPALAAVPVATAFGWRASLGVWVALAVVALVPWIVASRARAKAVRLARESDDADAVESEPALESTLFRSPVAWAIMFTFCVSSINVYAAFAWLPSLLVQTAHVDRRYGRKPARPLCDRRVPQRAGGAGDCGPPEERRNPHLLRDGVPGALRPRAASAARGGHGRVGRARRPRRAALPAVAAAHQSAHAHTPGSVALSGFVQGVGYIIAAASPLVFGLLHQATDGWAASLLFILVVSLVAIPAGDHPGSTAVPRG